MTLICVPILVDSLEQAALDAREARDRGADLVEFRIDPYYTGSDDDTQVPGLVRLVSLCPLPCIVTCRPVLEGGQYDGEDAARVSLMERLGTAAGTHPWGAERAPRYIDVELATYARSANIKQKINLAVDHPAQQRDLSTGLILSSHDFHTRPDDLLRQIERMAAQPACSIIKVAYRARSIRDNLELLDLAYEASGGALSAKPMIALGMGPFGLMSRVLAPKFGGFLTFAALRRDSATAPGQPVIDELVNLYRFGSIAETTKVYGIVGYPVEHSLSPLVHNAGFDAIEHDGVYLPLPVPPEYEHFKASVLTLIEHAGLDFAGASVTIPHKEHLVRLAREQLAAGDDRWSIDRLSDRCGAGNTLVLRRDVRGSVVSMDVHNTDGPAVASCLRGIEPRRVALVGTGGTTRAAAGALLDEGAEVVIVSRELQRAYALADELGSPRVRVAQTADLPGLELGAVMNCTPVGMSSGPSPQDSPISPEILVNLPRGCVVAEAVYSPLTTPLLRQAQSAGLKTVCGLEMFVAQASEQFRLWTGREAPASLFMTITRETLESRE